MKMSNNLGSNVNLFLGLQCQFKILHWQTKGYARHIAFGNIYDTLDGLIDQYVEISMGKFGRFSIDESSRNIEIYNLLDIEIVKFLQKIKEFLILQKTLARFLRVFCAINNFARGAVFFKKMSLSA